MILSVYLYLFHFNHVYASDFKNIKDVLKKDGLDTVIQEKKKKEAQKKLQEEALLVKKYETPAENNFWSFFSEWWLVKNHQVLKWDFYHPDFELEKNVGEFFKSQGIYGKKIKILLLDTPEIYHLALPSDDSQFIFLISLPFMKELDLSKEEISIMLYEDYLRKNQNFMKNYITSKELKEMMGINFKSHPELVKLSMLESHLQKYNKFIWEKGFSFQEQFEVTKEMEMHLKNRQNLLTGYINYISKVDRLIKNSSQFKNYSKLYPAPELQLNWLKPVKPTL